MASKGGLRAILRDPAATEPRKVRRGSCIPGIPERAFVVSCIPRIQATYPCAPSPSTSAAPASRRPSPAAPRRRLPVVAMAAAHRDEACPTTSRSPVTSAVWSGVSRGAARMDEPEYSAARRGRVPGAALLSGRMRHPARALSPGMRQDCNRARRLAACMHGCCRTRGRRGRAPSGKLCPRAVRQAVPARRPAPCAGAARLSGERGLTSARILLGYINFITPRCFHLSTRKLR